MRRSLLASRFSSSARPSKSGSGNGAPRLYGHHKEDLFNFTRGRFVSNEGYEMSQRYVCFNLHELARVAAEAVGSKSCIGTEKYPDGMYNKALLMTMDDGNQAVAKIPNPNAGRSHFTTASEVATMGIEDRFKIVKDIARFQKSWMTCSFRGYGSLYYWEGLETPDPKPLYTDRDGVEVMDSRFAIGPSTGRGFSDDGRSTVEFDRGPCDSQCSICQKHQANKP